MGFKAAESADRSSCLEVRNLTKLYGPIVALSDLSFEVERGEIFGYLGPNGAGKTTTLRLILGLQRPTSGEVSIGGVRVVPHSAESVRARGRVGFLTGELGLYRDMTG